MNTNRFAEEKGSALIIGLMILSLITLLGMTLLARVNADNSRARDDRESALALCGAEAGCTEVVGRMTSPSATNYIGPASTDLTKPGWGAYLRQDGNTVEPLSTADPDFAKIAKDGLDNDADKLVDEVGESYKVTTLPHITDSTNKVSFSWAKAYFLRNSTGTILRLGDADKNTYTPPTINGTVGEPVIIVRAMGVAGNEKRMVEFECVRTSSTSRFLIRNRREIRL